MTRPASLVFHIGTIPSPPETFDEPLRTTPSRSATPAEEEADAFLGMGRNAFTARVTAVAVLNPDTSKGKVFYEHPGGNHDASGDGLVEFHPGGESEIIKSFWEVIVHYPRLVSFNGRVFDGPFLMLRSAILGIAPSRTLIPYRFSATTHCDLLEQLSYYGAARRFDLDFYCRGFGIAGPATGRTDGSDPRCQDAGERYREIAENCLRETRAAAELFRLWEAYLSFENCTSRHDPGLSPG